MDNQEAIRKFQSLIEKVDEPLQISFQSMHQGFPTATLTKFLIARDWDIAKAHKMLVDCLQWRVQNEIDSILAKPIVPAELYRLVRDTQLIGLSGFSKEGIPVIIVGVGQSTHDKASVDCYVQSHIQMNEYRDRIVLPEATKKYGRHISTCIKILDMTGLRLSALNQIKVVKPLLHERTRNRIQVLQGSGQEELLTIMDYSSLPHFCRKQSSGSARVAADGTTTNCFSLDHPFHQQLYSYVKQQAGIAEAATALKQSSVHVRYPPPDPEEVKIVKTIESELRRVGDLNGLNKSFSRVQGNGF
ncbi:Phosphatidylinositol/phosphatidylcholine transfer protein SFH2 [Linum perenne]